jgi:hypothetical protein
VLAESLGLKKVAQLSKNQWASVVFKSWSIYFLST